MSAGAAKALTSSRLQNHFELFGLAPAYALDPTALERSYRDIQSRVHPDRFAHAGDAERRASLQWTTRVNEAYRTLKDPVQRAKHILDLQGVDVAFETNTQMPTDFLLQQLELREELEGAVQKKDAPALDAMRARLRSQKQSLEKSIGEAIDTNKNYPGAADLVRKLMFLDRLDAEIDEAYEDVE
jgi:molecular chaperone HscB